MSFSTSECRAINERFAAVLVQNKARKPTNRLITEAVREIDGWFHKIPMAVTWKHECEPYDTFDQMKKDIGQGNFQVNDYAGYLSPIWGESYRRMRAVHDFYGHYEANNPFGIIGELSAYGVHIGMFSPKVMPLIFNEIVLANACREVHGSAPEKYVPFVA